MGRGVLRRPARAIFNVLSKLQSRKRYDRSAKDLRTIETISPGLQVYYSVHTLSKCFLNYSRDMVVLLSTSQDEETGLVLLPSSRPSELIYPRPPALQSHCATGSPPS